MKLKFALSLSFKGISLLRLTPEGWVRLREIGLGGDLDQDMRALHELAVATHPKGHRVGLIIPNEQIRYLDLPDLGGDESARETAIRAALDGATPYKVDELSFDYTIENGRLRIAAVANETLEEAEGFAQEHGFVPMAAMAIAPEDAFAGAVFFGKSRIWKGNAPQRPADAIVILDAPPEPAPQDPVAKPADPAPAADMKPDMAAPSEQGPSDAAELAPASAAKIDTGATAPVKRSEKAEDTGPTDKAPNDEGPVDMGETDAPDVTAPAPQKAAKSADNAVPAAPVPAPAPAGPKAAAPTVPSFSSARAAAATVDIAPDAPPTPAAAKSDGATPSFSSIRATRATEAIPPAPRPLKLDEDAQSGITRRFTPVVTPGNVARDAGVTSDKLAIDDAEDDTRSASGPVGAAAAAMRFLTRRKRKDTEEASPERAAKKTAPDAPKLSKVLPRPPEAPMVGATQKPGHAAEEDAAPVAARKAPAVPKAPKRSVAPAARVAPPLTGDAPPHYVTPKEPARPKVQPLPVVKKQSSFSKAASAFATLKTLRAGRAKAASGEAAPAQADASRRKPALSGMTRKAAKAPASIPMAQDVDTSERDRMTVFGARNRDAAVGGKPRFLGVMLTGGLLAFLAIVAAWSLVFMDDGLARFFRDDGEPPVVIASLPDPAAPQAAPAAAIAALPEQESEAAPDVQIASLETGPEITPDAPVEALNTPIAPRALSAEEAAATYAATGIWQRAPAMPMEPPADAVDTVYVASIDPGVQQFDAVALPNPEQIGLVLPLADPGLPPPSDMRFEFDARGLIRATPEGALSPDGLRIYAGLPPVVPPLRDVRDAPARAPDPDDPQAAPDAQPELSSVRPEARPDDVVEQRERVTLRGVSRDELARLRPAMRPVTAQEEAEAEAPEAPATDLAIDRSLVPVTRPRNMNAIVRRAEQAQERAEVRTASAAAVAPRAVTPDVPSAASVTRAATVRNAINLNRINLIGVYGTSSNRRALVRLANGRYLKVKVGDRLDGGRVSRINESELRYSKGGRSVTLKMPRG